MFSNEPLKVLSTQVFGQKFNYTKVAFNTEVLQQQNSKQISLYCIVTLNLMKQIEVYGYTMRTSISMIFF